MVKLHLLNHDPDPHVTCTPRSHDLTNVIYRGVAGKEKGGQGRAPSPYQLLLDKLVKSNLLCYTRTKLGSVFLSWCN